MGAEATDSLLSIHWETVVPARSSFGSLLATRARKAGTNKPSTIVGILDPADPQLELG